MLERAIRSVVSQQGVTLEVLVVVNGNRIEPSLLKQLEDNSDLRVLKREEGNVSAARYHGVCSAKSEFFCFLDDDDEFLPGAMLKRLELFEEHPNADVIVTNGYTYTGRDELHVSVLSAEEINREPAMTLLKMNWFASLAPTFRKATCAASFFNIRYRYFELTYLFFVLISSGKKIVYDASLTYRRFADNPLSSSKSDAYAAFYPTFLQELYALPLEREIKRAINGKYISALNNLSGSHLSGGRMMAAWRAHLECLRRGGWQFLPYTRHLLKALIL